MTENGKLLFQISGKKYNLSINYIPTSIFHYEIFFSTIKFMIKKMPSGTLIPGDSTYYIIFSENESINQIPIATTYICILDTHIHPCNKLSMIWNMVINHSYVSTLICFSQVYAWQEIFHNQFWNIVLTMHKTYFSNVYKVRA